MRQRSTTETDINIANLEKGLLFLDPEPETIYVYYSWRILIILFCIFLLMLGYIYTIFMLIIR